MKTMEEIYQELAAEFQRITGLSAAGCGDLAVRFRAVAAQLYGLYAQADWTRRQCFPQTAEGEMLDRHGWERDVTRREAERAAGTVRFFAADDRVGACAIPAGTVCMTAGGLRFVTLEDGMAGTGESFVDIPVEAVEAGAQGNVAADTVIYLAVPPTGVTACTNPEAMTGGLDREDDEGLRQRVLATYRRLANGANSAFYYQTAMSFDGVAAATVIPRSRGVGTVDVVIAAREGMPDGALLEAVSERLNDLREIAVDVTVLAPREETVDVAVTVTVEEGRDFAAVSAEVDRLVRNWFGGQRLGCPVLRAELTALVFGADGVANCELTLPGADVAIDGTTLPILGTLTIAEG